MPTSDRSCPTTSSRVIELYFLEHRAKLIDIAAFLDRLDRADADGGGEDFRVSAFREAIGILSDGCSQRSRRILEKLSDPTAEPIASAEGLKGACGAYPGAHAAAGGGP